MAAGSYVRPGLANTYVQSMDATGNLVIHYSRDPKSFPLARYAKYHPVKKTTGLYLQIKAEETARIINSNLADYLWEDGNDRPVRQEAEEFRLLDYRTQRYDFPWNFGKKTVEEADFPIVPIQQQVAAHKAMVARSLKAATLLQATGNYDTGHYAAVNDIDGVVDYWDVSTVDESNIKRSILYAIEKIEQDTFGMVKQEDLVLVMNPTTARRISTAPELLDFVKQQATAPGIVQGKDPFIAKYGLPKYLHGVEVLVDNTFYISNRVGSSTQTKTYTIDNGKAVLLSRPGSIEAPAGGGPSFSSLTFFFLEEMTVEQKDDTDNRRISGHVVDDYALALTSPASTFLFTSIYDTSSS